MILYRMVRALIKGICRVYWRLTFEGLENVPKTGSFVLAPVHRSWLDFALVSGITKRRMRYLGKDSLWKFKPLGTFISVLGAFPVRRGSADREAFHRCIDIINGGEPLVLFPEGTRRSGPVVENLFEGAAYVAARTGVPIVPVGIGGSERALAKGSKFPRPVKIHVIVGPAISAPQPRDDGRPASRKTIHAVTEQLQTEIQTLFDEAQVKADAKRA